MTYNDLLVVFTDCDKFKLIKKISVMALNLLHIINLNMNIDGF